MSYLIGVDNSEFFDFVWNTLAGNNRRSSSLTVLDLRNSPFYARNFLAHETFTIGPAESIQGCPSASFRGIPG